MKYTFWGMGLIMLGLCGVVLIVMFEAITINNESEYYVLKETMEAAMLESIDLACYRVGDENGDVLIDTGSDGIVDSTVIDGACGDNELKIIEQAFVENFTRRFAKSINGSVQNYTIEFYDIMEMPPKATVVIKGKTKSFGILSEKGEDVTFDLTNNLSGILELNE